MRRELRSVRTEQVVGAVELAGAIVRFEGHAGAVLAGMRRRLGDRQAAEAVMLDGWSNGYLYFAEVSRSPE